MLRSFISRFSTPGGLSEDGVFLSSVVLIFAICWLDVKTGADIRPRILYVFPLTAIALHSERMPKVFLGFALTVLCEVGSLLKFHLSPAAEFIDRFTGFAGLVLVAALARTARKHYLETLVLATQDPLTNCTTGTLYCVNSFVKRLRAVCLRPLSRSHPVWGTRPSSKSQNH
jgi:hypothetical protein